MWRMAAVDVSTPWRIVSWRILIWRFVIDPPKRQIKVSAKFTGYTVYFCIVVLVQYFQWCYDFVFSCSNKEICLKCGIWEARVLLYR